MPEPSKTQRQPLSFTATDWKDDKTGGTPITAAQLNRVEKGIQDAVRGVNDINTRIMSYLVQSDGEHATQDANGAAIVPPCYVMDWSTKTTWFDNGTDPRFTPFATAEEMKAVRDSLSRVVYKYQLVNVKPGESTVQFDFDDNLYIHTAYVREVGSSVHNGIFFSTDTWAENIIAVHIDSTRAGVTPVKIGCSAIVSNV